MIKPELVAVPERIRERWPDIRAAMVEICGWAEDHSRGYIEPSDVMGGIPDRLPELVPLLPKGVFDLDEVEGINPESRLYLKERDFGDDWAGRRFEQPKVMELSVDTFCVFRMLEPDLKVINDEYGGGLSENERQIHDGDSSIVVYML